MYAAPGSINGVPVQFLIDTGATQVAMNKNEARRLGIDYARTSIEAAVHTASGITRSYQITLRRFGSAISCSPRSRPPLSTETSPSNYSSETPS